ncbi:hypothetical protein DYBT9275_00897 [Dyadobacter sp. CECT 9275]|uniref:Uncharacterized protein n=1 Tax=Dyadobacter helix TaxID=2822344 RepID=A0A916J8T9_9BACT|nr:hypothetical protein [Dyadobacter sp. CECT 9275]CAG4992117.1 hypothetical protein DYBT9275_00897 [Dyadobacter sp. CECT 9275]
MRQHNKYLEKVYEEMDVYHQHLHTGRELSMQQQQTFEKIDIVRGWLRDGLSDIDVIKLAKSDPRLRVQDRRARELLSMAYEVFADLRQLRNRDGIKFMYAELMRKTADKVIQDYERLRDSGEDYRAAAALLREYKNLLKEAAVIDGAYDTSKLPDEQKKKPTKIIIKRKTVISNSEINSDDIVQEAHYETVE